MIIELTVKHHPTPKKVQLVVPQRRLRKTALARRRRLNAITRELATDLGFENEVTLAERGVLHQAATLLLQVEVAGDSLVSGATLDPDTCIRLSSEARRLLSALRKRAVRIVAPLSSPLRSRLLAKQQRTPERGPSDGS